MTAKAKGPKGKADLLYSRWIRSRGECEACAVGWEPMPKVSAGQLETSHIISRRYSATRVWTGDDETPCNAFAICSSHHQHFTLWPYQHARFIESKIGVAGYDALKNKAESNPRPWRDEDWKAECERLTALLAEVES